MAARRRHSENKRLENWNHQPKGSVRKIHGIVTMASVKVYRDIEIIMAIQRERKSLFEKC